MTKIVYSQYQLNVFDAIKNTKNNLAINAVAGSGKTFTIVEAVKQIPSSKSVLFLAFNKSIADELSNKLSAYPNVECRTLHSLGNSALKSFKLRLKNKYYEYGDQCLLQSDIITVDSDNALQLTFKSNCNKLYNLARLNLIKNDDLKGLENLADHHNLTLIGDEIKVVNSTLLSAYELQKDQKTIDFTDMLVLGITYKRFLSQYDFVFIDECQDLSAAQRELMLAAVKPNGGRFIAVGDPKQAINGFAGATNNSFELIATLPNTKTLPLSVNYRCGSDIVSLAQGLVPQITAHEGAIKGEIIDTTNLKDAQAGDMIICRKSAPLVSVCLKLLNNGKRANIKGRDMGEGLKNLVVKMKAKNLHSLFCKLDDEKNKLEKEIAKRSKNPKDTQKYITFADKIECLSIIAESCLSIAELKAKLDKLFTDTTSNNIITLSTIHKSKGLEADNVFILCPDKLPLTWKNQQAWELEQEFNLKYVAITRAKKKLTFVNVAEDSLKNMEY